MNEKIISALAIITAALIVGIPSVLLLPDRAVTWPELAGALIWGAVGVGVLLLLNGLAGLRRSNRDKHRRLQRIRDRQNRPS